MAQQVWLPVDGALLKKLREDAHVEITALARMHSLSTAQVKQLEDGGDSSFYTAAIKLATGRKLLMHFGADVQPLAQTPEENLNVQHEMDLVATKQNIDIPPNTPGYSEKTKNYFRFLASGVAVIFLGFVFVNIYNARPKTESKPDDLAAQTSLLTSSITDASPSKSAEVKAVALPEASMQTLNEVPAECKWTEEPISLLGYQPTKSGDYVHLVAKADGAICVRDATGRSQTLHLKNTQSQTVKGHPPFEIFSHNLHQFQVFYQGNLLRLPSNGIKNITLKEQKI